MVSLVIVIAIIIFALGAPIVSKITGFSYTENHLSDKLSKPGENGYILGSDGNGRDILTRLAYGGRVSLLVAMFATIAEIGLALTLGLIAGYRGKWIDAGIMRIVDVLLSIPSTPLLILIATLYSPGVVLFALMIGAVSWPGDCRLFRGQTLAMRGREYIESARVVGVPAHRIVIRHLLPNLTPILLVQISFTIPSVILTEALLSFIGLGVQVPTPSWGNMLNEAERFYRTNWQNVFIPGAMIYIASLTLFLVGSGLRDALDPRITE